MDKYLPNNSWFKREDLNSLVEALGVDEVRYVGGAVRDTLLGLPVKDIDMATRLVPREVIRRLEAAEIRHVPTGIDHGTITAIPSGGPVEITTLRHDVSTDGRRATVAFASDWKEDAARRDFTINALYADPLTGKIHDWFGGIDDLANGHIRFIGDASQRIREDHLRILRYFRFQARFGRYPADPEAENSCRDLASTLKGLSRERVGMEMMNLLSVADPTQAITRMEELGVLAVILPEADVDTFKALVAEEKTQNIAPDALRRLAALLPPDPALAEHVASRFRLSGAQRKRLALAASRPADVRGAKALTYRIGHDCALDALLLAGSDASSINAWEPPVFPLKGGEIVARGISAGPEVARILREVEDRWIGEAFPPRDRVDEILADVIGSAG